MREKDIRRELGEKVRGGGKETLERVATKFLDDGGEVKKFDGSCTAPPTLRLLDGGWGVVIVTLHTVCIAHDVHTRALHQINQ